jgi:hypothetical protein
MSVAFKELAGSPVETYDCEGFRARRLLLCNWDDRQSVVERLLGDGYEFGGQGRAPYPGKPDIVAISVHCEPFTDDVAPQVLTELTEGLNRYRGFAKQLTVCYELLVRSDRPDVPTVEKGTFLTYRQDREAELLSVADDSIGWTDQPEQPVPEVAVPVLRIPVMKHQFTWHRVVSPPWDGIRNCIGTLNQKEFVGAGPETVLFDGAKAQREFLRIDGLAKAELAWRIDYLFREKAVKTDDGEIVGFNHSYRSLPADNPGWDRLVDGAGNPLYRSSDFAQLFQFEATSGA